MTRYISFIFASFLLSFSALANSIHLQGKFEQGSLIKGNVPPQSQVLLNGKPVQVAKSGDFVFGFEREAKPEHELKVIYPNGLTEIKPLKVTAKKYKIDRVNGISKKIMKPDPKALARAKKDGKQVRAARNTESQQTAIFTDFIWPVTGRISGVYGSQRVYNGKPGRPHYGVDVARNTGTPIVSPADGVITLAVPDMFYSGGTVIIDHGFGVSSSMLHLSKLYVKQGQKVKQGEPIAEIGATGRVTGPHLDWRLNWFQMRLDPTSIVPDMKSVMKKK
ncbi:M23 family metallopeptidase [Shewanella sp. 202IG2-18]|uniref:M23 family metallopeptidase n=1 Tax=Parashewanella hymeniacidonis TaxID=2807618 RepID=UPI0019601183|nr:M23 family metallopeptidase [Parashewanella hymeniacidonis]MBM7074147.1 M23 family metallopeptidase [Parashewanella hymeniacidonis]